MQTEKLVRYTLAIHGAICNCDDKNCHHWQEIEDWLHNGYFGDKPTIKTLINEYKELLESAEE